MTNYKPIKELPKRKHFLSRFVTYYIIATGLLIFSLGLGVIGYHFSMDLPWIDSLLNASMILTGMGPVNIPDTVAGKLFSSFYAVYSGVAFLSSVAILFSPILHRFLHKFHISIRD
jgi:hypothetical protein